MGNKPRHVFFKARNETVGMIWHDRDDRWSCAGHAARTACPDANIVKTYSRPSPSALQRPGDRILWVVYKFESAVMGQVGSTPVAIALVLPVTAPTSVLTPEQAPTKLFVCIFESTRKDRINYTTWDVRDTAEGTGQYLDLPLCVSVSSYLTGTANAYFGLISGCSSSTSLFFSGPEKITAIFQSFTPAYCGLRPRPQTHVIPASPSI